MQAFFIVRALLRSLESNQSRARTDTIDLHRQLAMLWIFTHRCRVVRTTTTCDDAGEEYPRLNANGRRRFSRIDDHHRWWRIGDMTAHGQCLPQRKHMISDLLQLLLEHALEFRCTPSAQRLIKTNHAR